MPRTLNAYRRHLISSSGFFAAVMVFSSASFAFNPDEEALPPSSSTSAQLPDPVLMRSPTATTGRYASPMAPVQMPAKPLYPERIGTPISSPLAVSMPPVDPAVQARAQAIMAAEQPAYATPQAAPAAAQPVAAGFVAPAPVFATAPMTAPVPPAPAALAATPAPSAAPAPMSVAVTPAPVMPQAPLVEESAKELSDETRTILSHVPAAMDMPKKQAGAIKMDRVDPEINNLLGPKAQEESYEAVGLSIKVRRPGLDTNYELNRAYTALMGGDTQTAIQTYKNIIGVEPRNEDALFGLAATYHRLGDIDKARPLYGMLLKVNPNHREGLNNFLVLVSDESPQDALPELERLEARNPDFSPIPAQIAIVLDKMGYADASREKMLRAIELAPDNMTYKYNFAVMLDRRGEHANAAALYKSLIQASLHGATVPASTDTMQKRLNHIVTEMTSARTAMGQ